MVTGAFGSVERAATGAAAGGGGLAAFLAGVTEDARGLLREGAVV